MTVLKHIRRLACVAAVGIVGLALASPARAQLTVTLIDSVTSETITLTDTAQGTPGEVTFNGGFGTNGAGHDFNISTFTVTSNYNGSDPLFAPPGIAFAYATDATITSTATRADTLIVEVGSTPFTAAASDSLVLNSSESSTAMSVGTSSQFSSSYTSSPVTETTTIVTLNGKISPPTIGSASSLTVSGSNPNGTFSIGNQLILSYKNGGETINVNGTTTVNPVPEPSSMMIAGIGALGLIAYGLRRKVLGA